MIEKERISELRLLKSVEKLTVKSSSNVPDSAPLSLSGLDFFDNFPFILGILNLTRLVCRQIHRAAQHPVELDMAQANAVSARIMLDLRVEASFTRLQTLTLQSQVQQLSEGVHSFGTPKDLLLSCKRLTSDQRSLPVSSFGICCGEIRSRKVVSVAAILVHLSISYYTELYRRGV